MCRNGLLSACSLCLYLFFFFFNDTATTEIYTLSLHDALPIYDGLKEVPPYDEDDDVHPRPASVARLNAAIADADAVLFATPRSEEHTSELQSLAYLVCRLLLEKKKKPSAHLAEITAQTPSSTP